MTHWGVFVKDRVCYVFMNGEPVEVFSVAKKEGGGMITYSRKHTIGQEELSPEQVAEIKNSLKSMKCIVDFNGQFLYDRSRNLHFQGLAKRIDDAGEVSTIETRTEEEADASRKRAADYLYEAITYMSIGPAFRERARQLALEGSKYDPNNEKLNELIERLS
ncbi:hypothetical protein KY340_01400 [Candidatus Woesearchaeota archaeon]|nr:hypothetical protein [Candidatus Woesearchaeota archaeon]